MKKFYLLLLTLCFATTSFGQVIITELADPNNAATARYVELYNAGAAAQDLTGWELRRWTNGNATPQGSGIDLTAAGIVAPGSFVLVAANATAFQTTYGIPADINGGTGGPADSNGDDQVALFDAADATIDIFGVPGEDGTGTCHEFEDGRAERVATISAPNPVFSEAEWNVWADSAVTGCTSHTNAAQDAPGIFDPGQWIGESNACGVSLGAVTVTCGTNTLGDNNDTVTIEIAYTGSDAGITSVTSTSTGTVGGDNPATVASGVITITGLSEGAAWDIVLNGGDCDGNSTSGMVPADNCDPDPNPCFDISGGLETFESVTVTPNSSMNEWTLTAGTYNMNGFCGGGCQEQIEAWLVFGPLDMTGVSDLSLAFNAVENFGTTDLVVAYTAAYPGCPSDATWTTAQTITMGGATLGARPTSTCVTCELFLGADTATCDTTTAGVDTYTATLAYTGGATTVYAVGASSGVVGGDDPNTVPVGTITVTGVLEGTDVTISIMDQGGICNLQQTITSPSCLATTCTNVGDVIITEIMQNPSINADPAGEFFELYNTTASPVDLQGWVIRDETSATETHTIGSSVIIPANGYVVIANGAALNGGLTPDYTYANDISLGNGTDGIIIECAATIIDQVIWDNGATFPDPSGASMELSLNAFTSVNNDAGSNWATAVSPYGDGDLGTPGAANDNTLSNDEFQVVDFSLYPNPTTTGFVTITNRNSAPISVEVYDLVGKQVISNTITNELNVSSLTSGMYIVKLSQNNTTVTKKLVIK